MIDPDTAFAASSALALVGWIALAVSPPRARWAPRAWRLAGRALPAALALVYVAMLVSGAAPEGGGFGSIAEVRALFASDAALAAGWIHYLAFDLFVGAWIARRAAELGIAHLAVLPVLAATFVLGPVGLLAFIALRLVLRKVNPSQGAG